MTRNQPKLFSDAEQAAEIEDLPEAKFVAPEPVLGVGDDVSGFDEDEDREVVELSEAESPEPSQPAPAPAPDGKRKSRKPAENEATKDEGNGEAEG